MSIGAYTYAFTWITEPKVDDPLEMCGVALGEGLLALLGSVSVGITPGVSEVLGVAAADRFGIMAEEAATPPAGRLARRAMRTLRTSAIAAVASVWDSSCIVAFPVGECATESPKLRLCQRIRGE
jgi:hypothetical protein